MNHPALLPANLAGWLQYIEALHPKSIAMGLERVAEVKRRMGLQPNFPIITVAGTNGKGSTCAMLEQVYQEAGYRVGCYTSPHILRYNERVRIAGDEASDVALCEAFAEVEKARGDIQLTYFEYGTLAAMWLLIREQVQVAVLEVGLGGRLDAVNVFEPDCAIVTSVDLDHIEFLGNNRESVGFEKAGVYRPATLAICGDQNPPQSLLAHAAAIGADLQCAGRDFQVHGEDGRTWCYQSAALQLDVLPMPALAGRFQLENAASVLTAVQGLQAKLPVSRASIDAALRNTRLQGRFEILSQQPLVILDVSHNPHAALALAENLRSHPVAGKTLAVFAMLADKDIQGVIAAVSSSIDAWYTADIAHPRGAKGDELAHRIREANPTAWVQSYPAVADAYQQACMETGENDRIIVFGSFFTVAEIMQQLRSEIRS